MKKIEPWKNWAFILSFWSIALFIHTKNEVSKYGGFNSSFQPHPVVRVTQNPSPAIQIITPEPVKPNQDSKILEPLVVSAPVLPAPPQPFQMPAPDPKTIPVLDPLALIDACWNSSDHEGDTANRALTAPIEVGVNLAFKPFTLLGRAFGDKHNHLKETDTNIRFTMGLFYNNWCGKTMSYQGVVESVSTKNKRVAFKAVGEYPKKVQVEITLNKESDAFLSSIKSGEALNVIGKISSLAAPEYMTLGINHLTLEDGSRYFDQTEGQ